jgi:iron complex outermembrane receptor protein
MKHCISRFLFLGTTLLAAAGSGHAEEVDAGTSGTFDLGVVTIVGHRKQVGEVGLGQSGSKVTSAEIATYNRRNVGEAVNLLPGVTLSTNSRNEELIYIRGFDARQAPLFIDGIPVYVPYDGYVDFNRFTTDDLASIQVAKGFSSISYGANALGGAINLVSRKPEKPLEGNFRAGAGSGDDHSAALNIGTNQGLWYLQGGISWSEANSFPLSDAFVPTATEDGGDRNNAYRSDKKVSLKLGITPNKTDEYTLSYIEQDGEKGQPPSTDPAAARYWQWPYWDKESLYFVSKTAVTDRETLKVRLYHDAFGNEVDSFTDATYATLKTSGSGSVSTGRSIYDDDTVGGSLELESRRLSGNTLKLVLQNKNDQHVETDANGLENTRFKDSFLSYGLEDNIALSDRLMLSLGYAHHEIKPEYVFSLGNAYTLPSKKSADNAQAGLFFDYTPEMRFYATVASKTRLPTLKDRYSQRLGSYIENPDLRPEKAVNYEIGYQGQLWQGAHAEVAIFQSDVTDKIQSAFVSTVGTSCSSAAKCQQQNIGEVRITGVELSMEAAISGRFSAGGNYTWLDLENRSNPATRLTDIPTSKLTLHAVWKPVNTVEVVAFAEHNAGRWASNALKLKGFTAANLKGVYHMTTSVSLEAGVNNLADVNYSMSAGFPSAGRTWFTNLNYTF